MLHECAGVLAFFFFWLLCFVYIGRVERGFSCYGTSFVIQSVMWILKLILKGSNKSLQLKIRDRRSKLTSDDAACFV